MGGGVDGFGSCLHHPGRHAARSSQQSTETSSASANAPGSGRWHPHELRHSAASIMLAQGVPIEVVSDILGHSSIRMTADVYGHILEPQRAAAADAMGEALWGNPGDDARTS